MVDLIFLESFDPRKKMYAQYNIIQLYAIIVSYSVYVYIYIYYTDSHTPDTIFVVPLVLYLF